MAKITGIEKASYKELVEARDAIEAALAKRKDEERAEVKRKVAELANESGSKSPSCSAASAVGRRHPGAKYRNPKDASQTWTGRGRKPNWLVEAVSQGAKLKALKYDFFEARLRSGTLLVSGPCSNSERPIGANAGNQITYWRSLLQNGVPVPSSAGPFPSVGGCTRRAPPPPGPRGSVHA